MTSHHHAAVWLDQHEARIFHVDLESSDKSVIAPAKHHVHRHPKGQDDRIESEDHYFRDVASALGDASDILLLGPSTTKLRFMRFLRERAPKIEAKIVGIETVDHPTDPQLVAYAKDYFHVAPPRVS